MVFVLVRLVLVEDMVILIGMCYISLLKYRLEYIVILVGVRFNCIIISDVRIVNVDDYILFLGRVILGVILIIGMCICICIINKI